MNVSVVSDCGERRSYSELRLESRLLRGHPAWLKWRAVDCTFELIVVGSGRGGSTLSLPSNVLRPIKAINHAWRFMRESHDAVERRWSEWSQIEALCDPVDGSSRIGPLDPEEGGSPFSWPLLWRLREPGLGRVFVLLSSPGMPVLPAFEMRCLSDLSQIEHGGLPLHAGAVSTPAGIYLFCGCSGAGKSTAVALSQRGGAEVIDDDQVVVLPRDDGKWVVRAWRSSPITSEMPVRALLGLRRRGRNQLLAVSPQRFALETFRRHLDVVGLDFPSGAFEKAWRICCRLVRSVPGFELSFLPSCDLSGFLDSELGGIEST